MRCSRDGCRRLAGDGYQMAISLALRSIGIIEGARRRHTKSCRCP
jgi:hypothetical protein